jgi:DNA-binding FadR family transcriptional regulator
MAHDAAVAAVFEPVAPPTTFEETVERLGSAIRLGILGPGTRLPPERELADQLGISRSTLRQALSTLTESGHLVAVRGRTGGTFVADVPPISSGSAAPLDDWRGLLDWRTVVELGAAQLAAERASDDHLEELQAALEAAEEAGGEPWPAYRRADVFFHLVLAEATRSPRIVAAMTGLQGEVTELFDRVTQPSPALEHANEQHRRIVAAVRAHDAAAAVAAMREHLVGTERIIEGLLP